MNKISKLVTGAAAAALVTTGFAAAPAQAQSYRYYDRDRGIDVGDVVAGVAIIGGIAAIASALGRDGDRYGYDRYDRYDARVAFTCSTDRYGRIRDFDVNRYNW